MKEYSIYETKTMLSAIVDSVIAGEECTISRNGKPVAMIVPLKKKKKKVKLGTFKNKIKLSAGWDKPLTEEELKQWGI